jgi:HEPN domain-containing protein
MGEIKANERRLQSTKRAVALAAKNNKTAQDALKAAEDSFKLAEAAFKTAETAFKNAGRSVKAARDDVNDAKNILSAQDTLKSAEDSFKAANAAGKATRKNVDDAKNELTGARADQKDAENCLEAAQKKWEVVDLAEDDSDGEHGDEQKSGEKPIVSNDGVSEQMAVDDAASKSAFNEAKAVLEADSRVEEAACQGVDSAKALLDALDGGERQPKKPRVSNDGAAEQVGVEDAASKEVGTIEYPDQVVVEGAGSPQVNGVYKRSGMFNDAPNYTMEGKWNRKDVVFELNQQGPYWDITVLPHGSFSKNQACFSHVPWCKLALCLLASLLNASI